jgi:hypothetical protein
MPDSGLLGLSLVCLVVGAAFILFPHPLLSLSQALNRTFATLDTMLVKHRYISGMVLFVTSYLCFRLALLVPLLRD